LPDRQDDLPAAVAESAPPPTHTAPAETPGTKGDVLEEKEIEVMEALVDFQMV
jgi:hypothetical protein